MHVAERIASALRDEIAVGALPVGERLPSERDLASRFDASPGTVRLAVQALVQEGLLDGGRGARKTVAGLPGRPYPFHRFQSFAQWANAQGHRPGGQVTHKHWTVSEDADTEALGIRRGSPLLAVTRVRTLDDRPTLVEHTRYVERVGRIVDLLPDETPALSSLLAEEHDIVFARAQHHFTAMSADDLHATLLHVRAGDALLVHRRTSYDRLGEALEWSSDVYRSDAVAIAAGGTWSSDPLRWTAAPDPFPGSTVPPPASPGFGVRP